MKWLCRVLLTVTPKTATRPGMRLLMYYLGTVRQED